MPLRPSYVQIHLSSLASNFQIFAQSKLGQHFMCPMVKANAYGHGDVQMVSALEKIGCQRFGVGLVEEGLRLRQKGGSRSEILVFGFNGKEAVRELLQHCLTPVVSDFGQLEQLISASDGEIGVHLKFNTGMHRLGFTQEQASSLFAKIAAAKKIKVLGLCTHLMSSEDLPKSDGSSVLQLQTFSQIVRPFVTPQMHLHAYNSSGAARTFAAPEIEQQYPFGLRIGLGLYGLLSCNSELSKKLYPVMQLKSKIVAIQSVKKGQSVSYGGTWTASKDSCIGIVPLGYADGIPTQLSNRGMVRVKNQSYPIVGRVCMDYTLIDVTNLPSPLNEDVEFFGVENTVHHVAEKASTHGYDILTRISERVPRIFLEETR